MSAARWSRRRNGETMTTIRVEFHIPRELVDWIMSRTGWGEARTLEWLKQKHVIARLTADFGDLGWQEGDDEPTVFGDVATDLEGDEYDLYNGPEVL